MIPSSLPAEHTHSFTLKSGKKLAYLDLGDPNGIPVFYFHGWPSARIQALSFQENAQKFGFRIISIDRPGIGQSEPIPKRTLQHIPPLIEELANHLSFQHFYLIGVSGGCPYTLATACAFNDRVLGTGIVCGAPPLSELPNRSEMIWPYRALLNMKPALPYLLPSALPLVKWVSSKNYTDAPLSWVVGCLSSEDKKMMAENLSSEYSLDSFREALTQGSNGMLEDSEIYTAPWNLDYAQITSPVHFWHGTADRNIPFAMAQHLFNQVPNAVPHWLEEEGHYTVPQKYSSEILKAFLENHH